MLHPTNRSRLAAAAIVAMIAPINGALAQQPCGGPVILAGHDADDHGFETIYAGLFDEIYANTTNGGFGILSIGSDLFSDASSWIEDVASLMAVPQPVFHVNDAAISTQSFTGFAIIHVPSDDGDTSGGINLGENALLALRAADLAAHVNAGGGLFGLTQGDFANAWEYVSVVAPVTFISQQYDDITSTPEGQALGIQDTNLDGCCFHNVFTSFPAYFDVLAVANVPGDVIDGVPAYVGGIQTCVLPFCGDGKLDPGEECDDGNTTDGDGCSAVCTNECVPVDRPPVIVCSPCERCNSALRCDADVVCADIATAIDPEGAPLTVSCDVAGPFPVGTTPVVVRASDGVTETEQVCTVVVKDCEAPLCVPPPDLALECNGRCGVNAADADVAKWLATATAIDNCPGVTLASIVPPLFASGCTGGTSSRVGFIATDSVGLERVCSAAITVKDTTAPVVTDCALTPAAPAAPASPSSPAPPRSPHSPRPPSSAPAICSSAGFGVPVKIDCGATADACDAAPTIAAKLIVSHYDVDPTGGCVLVTEDVPVECGELVELVRLAPPCPASPPSSASASPPVVVNDRGVRVISGEDIRLEVVATDGCGLASAACTVDAFDPSVPMPCEPARPRCDVPLCGT